MSLTAFILGVKKRGVCVCEILTTISLLPEILSLRIPGVEVHTFHEV